MGRSVSYPSGAIVAFRTLEIEDEDDWEWEYECLVEEIIETARSTFPSLEPCDGWRGREDSILLRNAFADCGISTYCGLVASRSQHAHRGDRIRWTRNDHRRGLFNADRARVVAIERGRVTVETSKGEQLQLKEGDPMLKRIDLAYALNAHMAQGLTSDRGIAVMDSRERNLSNQQTFLVTVTRLRDHLTLVVDSAAKLGGAVARNKGGKASALEVTERLRDAAASGVSKGRSEQLGRDSERELSREKTRAIDIGI